MTSSSRLLPELVTKTLSCVAFVADYLQLNFNGPRLSCYAWPVVVADEQPLHFGDSGYRDALCSLLMREVTAASDTVDRGISLAFGDSEVRLKPSLDELVGPEIAMLQMNNEAREWEVWRPGEGSFARQSGS